MYFPSIVELITAPTIWSALVTTLLVTIPIILIISLIKALIIRKSSSEKFKHLLEYIFIMTFITGLIRIPVFVWSFFWPGLFISYILTIYWEALLIRGWIDMKSESREFKPFLLLSIKMNTVIYALLAVVLASLIYIPYILNSNPEMRKTLSGNLLLITGSSSYRTFNINDDKFTLEKERFFSSYSQCFSKISHNSFVGVDEECKIKRFKLKPNGLISESIIGHIKQFEKIIAISKDARLILCNLDKKLVVYDCKMQKTILKIPSLFDYYRSAQFGSDFILITGNSNHTDKAVIVNLKNGAVRKLKDVSVYYPALSPDSRQIAWRQDNIFKILNLESMRVKNISVPVSRYFCDESYYKLTWSQDGQYIVYIGATNQFLQNCFRSDLVAVNTKNGQHTTLCKYIGMIPTAHSLLWL